MFSLGALIERLLAVIVSGSMLGEPGCRGADAAKHSGR